MLREFTCIVCPNGCDITAEIENGEIRFVTGAACRRGEAYARQELTDPRRTIASSVAIKGGALPLASVRLDAPAPKDRIFDVMDAIRKVELTAPVRIGDIAIADVLGLGCNVVVTKNIDRV